LEPMFYLIKKTCIGKWLSKLKKKKQCKATQNQCLLILETNDEILFVNQLKLNHILLKKHHKNC
jgi:hypothetical protein